VKDMLTNTEVPESFSIRLRLGRNVQSSRLFVHPANWCYGFMRVMKKKMIENRDRFQGVEETLTSIPKNIATSVAPIITASIFPSIEQLELRIKVLESLDILQLEQRLKMLETLVGSADADYDDVEFDDYQSLSSIDGVQNPDDEDAACADVSLNTRATDAYLRGLYGPSGVSQDIVAQLLQPSVSATSRGGFWPRSKKPRRSAS